MKEYFEIPGPPQGKARARTFYNPKIGKSQSITPDKTVLYENLIKQSFLSNCKGRWFDGEPLALYITALYPIPKSATKKNRELMIQNRLLPTKKPDADNIAKVVCDALNGIAYKDDTQVVKLVVNKLYTVQEPKVFCYIERYKIGDYD